MTGKLGNILKNNSLLPPSQFSYRRDLGTCDALLTLCHQLQIALDGDTEGKLVQWDFKAASDRVTHRGMLYMLWSLDIEDSYRP